MNAIVELIANLATLASTSTTITRTTDHDGLPIPVRWFLLCLLLSVKSSRLSIGGIAHCAPNSGYSRAKVDYEAFRESCFLLNSQYKE